MSVDMQPLPINLSSLLSSHAQDPDQSIYHDQYRFHWQYISLLHTSNHVDFSWMYASTRMRCKHDT